MLREQVVIFLLALVFFFFLLVFMLTRIPVVAIFPSTFVTQCYNTQKNYKKPKRLLD